MIYDYYKKNLNNLKKFKLIEYKKNIFPSYHLFFLHLKNASLKAKKKFFNYMRKNKINVMYHYIPIYKFKSFKGNILVEIKYFLSSVSLPIYYSLNKNQQKYIIKKIKAF